MLMAASALGYVIVESRDVSRWRVFATEVLGLMAAADGADGSLRLRVDERPFRLLVIPGTADRFFAAGWEFSSEESFDACIASLRSADMAVHEASSSEAKDRCVHRLARCQDPAGNRLELYCGRFLDYTPFSSPAAVSGFVTGDMGMGHVVLPAPEIEACRSFYKRHLGFDDTDEMRLSLPSGAQIGLYFMHAANRRHHSLALMNAPSPSGCVHIMLEAKTLDDVGYALDRCLAHGVHVTATLGRHSNDMMLSFYAQTPGGFDIEFGCDGIQPDWSTWVPTRSLVPDLWGHRFTPAPQAGAHPA